MLTITKKPKAANQGGNTFSLNVAELSQIQNASTNFPVKIEVLNTSSNVIKTIAMSKFKKLNVTPKTYNGDNYYLVDYSKC